MPIDKNQSYLSALTVVRHLINCYVEKKLMLKELKMKKLLILMALFLGSTAQAGLADHLEPTKVQERVRQEFADLDINFNIDLLDVDLFEGLGLSSRYRYEVEPSYEKGLHSRVDKWQIKLDLKPGDILGSTLDTPVYFNINRNSEVYFVRQYKSKKRALTALPYTLAKLPLTADLAIKSLLPGDFVSLPASMSIVIGASASSATTGTTIGIDAKANVYYVLSGSFLIHIYRMKDNKVRLKLFANRTRTAGTSAEVEGSSNLFGVKIANKIVENVFELDFAEIGYEKAKGRQFIIDYVFDLNNKKAKEAYNNILSSTYKFKDVVALGQHLGKRPLSKVLLSTYEKADNLFKEDYENQVKKPRVDRIFKGFNKFDQDKFKLKLGLIVAKLGSDRTYTENNISFEDEVGLRHNFYYPIQTKTYEQKIRLGFFKTKERISKSYFALVPTGIEDNGSKFSDFGLRYERQDKMFRDDEQASVKEFMANNLPGSVFEQIDWKDWTDFTSKKDARIFYQIVLKASAFDQIPLMSKTELKEALYTYVKTKSHFAGNPLDWTWDRAIDLVTTETLTRKWQLKSLAKKLHPILFNTDLSGKKRVNLLMDIRNRNKFREFGIGFVMSLIPKEKLADHLQVRLELSAKDKGKVDFKFGNQELSDLYRQLQHVQNAINNRSYDLRLNSTEFNN